MTEANQAGQQGQQQGGNSQGAQGNQAGGGASQQDTIVNGAGANGAQQGQQQNGQQQAENGQQQNGQQQQAPAFPDNWRETFAGEDKGALKDLGKYTDPGAVYKALRSLQGKVSAGEYKAQLHEGASEAEVAAFRKSNGLPEKAEAYVAGLKLPDGVVLGEADKPLVAHLAEHVAHKGMWSQQQLNDVVAWYYGSQDAMALKAEEADAAFKTATEDALRTEWGGDYRPNINAVDNLVARMPAGMRDSFLTARIELEAGRSVPLGNHPEFIKWAAGLERELNPVVTLIPPGGNQSGKGLAERIAVLDNEMKNSSGPYWKGPKDASGETVMQVEYRKLIEARDKMAARSA